MQQPLAGKRVIEVSKSSKSSKSMQERYKGVTLGSLADVPCVPWFSASAKMHRWSAFAAHIRQYMLRVDNKRDKLWSKEHDSDAVEAIDLKVFHSPEGSRLSLEKIIFPDDTSIKDIFSKQKPIAGSCRILSISAENSVSPFGIKEGTIFGILQQNNVPVTFLDIILAFGQKPGNGDAGMARSTVRRRSESDLDIHYLLTYVELAEGARENEVRYWTTRQIGLYQYYSRENDSGFCILLQPQKQSIVQRSIDYLDTDYKDQPKSCFKAFLDVHLIVLSSYFQNWQVYLTVLSNNFEDLAKMVLTIKWDDLRDYEDGQEQLQRLHYLQDRLFVVSPRLGATLEIVRTLETLEGLDILHKGRGGSESAGYRRQFSDELKNYKTVISGVLDSAKSLERRMEGILTMLSAALNLRHQATGLEISGGVLKLTNETVDDSATVRVITFVTLLYMPPTFIATLLGTNLFIYSSPESNKGFQISPQFWILVALAIPLTLFTVGCWYFYTRRRKNLKSKKPKGGKIRKTNARWLKTVARRGLIGNKRAVKDMSSGSPDSEGPVTV